MRRALFLDRDGVINVDRGYVSANEDFQLLPGILELLRLAQSRGYLLIVVTNQSGIARGIFTHADYIRLETHMRMSLSAAGINLTGVYHCPHHPNGSVPQFAITCSCRKPKPGLILRAARENNLDLAGSILIGDKQSDLDAACSAGVGESFLIDSAAGKSRDIFDAVAAALLSK